MTPRKHVTKKAQPSKTDENLAGDKWEPHSDPLIEGLDKKLNELDARIDRLRNAINAAFSPLGVTLKTED